MTLELALFSPGDPEGDAMWQQLVGYATSYFVSRGWVENWLASVPPNDRPMLAIVRRDGAPIAACHVGRRRILRHLVIASRERFFNTTGDARFDELCIEHNQLVRAPGATLSLRDVVELLPDDWDELALPGIDAGEVAALASHDLHVCTDREVASPYVDLARVRAAREGYLGVLGPTVRAQIRRARRGVGTVCVEHATDLTRALEIYDELVAIHGASWRARGVDGAFADPWFGAFHRQLIVRRFATGEIDLVRVSTADHVLGCLYNFVYRGRVSFYQSGLACEADPRIKAGHLCHAAAIEDAALAGHAIYDFLGGDARYKQELSTDATRLAWVRVQRPRVRFAVEETLRSWRHAIRARTV